MNPYKILAAIITAVALAVGATLGVQQILSWKAGAELAVQQQGTMQAGADIQAKGDEASSARTESDAGVATGRDNFNQATDEDRRNEPETAARDDRNVPASRLRAFQERRANREKHASDRLGRAGVQREEGLGTEVPPER